MIHKYMRDQIGALAILSAGMAFLLFVQVAKQTHWAAAALAGMAVLVVLWFTALVIIWKRLKMLEVRDYLVSLAQRAIPETHGARQTRLRQRQKQRSIALYCSLAFGLVFIFWGVRGASNMGVPLYWHGALFVGMFIAEKCGFNVWNSGPLDPAGDPRGDFPNEH